MTTKPRVLSESYLMNTNITGFRWFSKIFASKVVLSRSMMLLTLSRLEICVPMLSEPN